MATNNEFIREVDEEYRRDQVAKPGCAGRPAVNTRLRVLETGEICVDLASEEAFGGYWNRPDADEKAMVLPETTVPSVTLALSPAPPTAVTGYTPTVAARPGATELLSTVASSGATTAIRARSRSCCARPSGSSGWPMA